MDPRTLETTITDVETTPIAPKETLAPTVAAVWLYEQIPFMRMYPDWHSDDDPLA